MKLVLAGGTGHLGQVLAQELRQRGHEVVVLSRRRVERSATSSAGTGARSGRGPSELDGADAVINLAGRSVNCRYNQTNLREMMDSRVDSTRAVGAGDRARRRARRASGSR